MQKLLKEIAANLYPIDLKYQKDPQLIYIQQTENHIRIEETKIT